LWYPGKPNAPRPWWASYYDRTRIQFRDRCLFANVPLPPDLQTVKQVDWASIDALAPRPRRRKPAAKKAATKSTAARKTRAAKTPAAKKKVAAKKKPRRRRR
jgi:hypothetical protein